MASANGSLDGSTRSKQKYRGWLTIRRSKPSKKKYNVQDAIPHNSPIPDEVPFGKVTENDDEDVPTLIQRLKVIETVEEHQDPKVLISTQRHLIEVLQKENAAFRILKTQVEKLRKENGELRAEVKLLRATTGSRDPNDPAEGGQQKGKGGKVFKSSQNGHIRRVSSENGLLDCNGAMTNGHGELTNGLTNGHLTHSVNGLTNGVDDPNGLEDVTRNGRHPNQRLARENGAGTSGTSLVTVSCLQKTMGKVQDCDETVQARLKARMAARGVDLVMNPWVRGQDAHQITVVFCLAASARVTADISRALEGIGGNSEVVLVMFHNVASSSSRQDPQSDTLPVPLQNVCLVIDLFFNKLEGLYRCEQNNRSMGRLFKLFDILC
ncbi:uncharacterized protein [Diadema setosum]|uniref:uncharacterized protein n=1 Tax=Diadema setosum TaxID=31175 RepID=UPI003B3B7A43